MVPGHGSSFTLLFPAYEPGPPSATVQAAEPAPIPVSHRAEGTILLVEDEAPVRAFASRALRLSGYTVIEAETAETALALLEDAAMAVDLFVTDVVMPGKDGPTWVTEALLKRPGVGVVFVSGYADDGFSRARPDPEFGVSGQTVLADPTDRYRATPIALTLVLTLGHWSDPRAGDGFSRGPEWPARSQNPRPPCGAGRS